MNGAAFPLVIYYLITFSPSTPGEPLSLLVMPRAECVRLAQIPARDVQTECRAFLVRR